MGVFRPSLEIGNGKAPDRKRKGKKGPRRSKEDCDMVETSGSPSEADIKVLEKAHRRAERRLLRARARLEQVESDLLLADGSEDIEDLRAEQAEAKARRDAAMREWERTKRDLAVARAKVKAEAMYMEEAEIRATPGLDVQVPGKPSKRVKKKAPRPRDEDEGASITKSSRVKVSLSDIKPEDGPEPVEGLEAEVVEEEEDAPIPGGPIRKKGFRWTPLKAIAVGVLLILVLPILLYGFVIPRVDVTVKTWYSEGFNGSIVVDTKIKNDGTDDVRDLLINISILKEVDGVETFITELTFDDPLVYPRSEQKVDSITFRDDQNADYILLVQVSFESNDKYVERSYTHPIDDPFMNIMFEDKIFMWAF